MHTHCCTNTSTLCAHWQVQDIRRANNLWSSESIQSRLVVKIPLSSGGSASRGHSPKAPRSPRIQSKHSSLVDCSPSATVSNGTAHKTFDENDEVVRSKTRQYVSSSASYSTDGVKSIADILNSADRQLKLSREFADRIAIRRSVSNLLIDAIVCLFICLLVSSILTILLYLFWFIIQMLMSVSRCLSTRISFLTN